MEYEPDSNWFSTETYPSTKQLWNHCVSVYEHWDFLILCALLGTEAISDFQHQESQRESASCLLADKNAPALLS